MVLRTGVAQEEHIQSIDKQIRAIFAEGTPRSLTDLMTRIRESDKSGGSSHRNTMRLVKALDFPEKADWLTRYGRYLRRRKGARPKPYRKATARLVTPEDTASSPRDSWAYEAIQQALEWGATRIVVDAINREVRATWSANKEEA